MSASIQKFLEICAAGDVAQPVSSALRVRRKRGPAKVVGSFLAARDLRGNGVSDRF